jgi:hypothetical protein
MEIGVVRQRSSPVSEMPPVDFGSPTGVAEERMWLLLMVKRLLVTPTVAANAGAADAAAACARFFFFPTTRILFVSFDGDTGVVAPLVSFFTTGCLLAYLKPGFCSVKVERRTRGFQCSRRVIDVYQQGG